MSDILAVSISFLSSIVTWVGIVANIGSAIWLVVLGEWGLLAWTVLFAFINSFIFLGLLSFIAQTFSTLFQIFVVFLLSPFKIDQDRLNSNRFFLTITKSVFVLTLLMGMSIWSICAFRFIPVIARPTSFLPSVLYAYGFSIIPYGEFLKVLMKNDDATKSEKSGIASAFFFMNLACLASALLLFLYGFSTQTITQLVCIQGISVVAATVIFIAVKLFED